MLSLVLPYAVQAFTVLHMIMSLHQPDGKYTNDHVAMRNSIILHMKIGPPLSELSVHMGGEDEKSPQGENFLLLWGPWLSLDLSSRTQGTEIPETFPVVTLEMRQDMSKAESWPMSGFL